MNRLTYSSSLSHLRRLKTPIDTGGKQTKPRQLHNTQWGLICPAETPEGAACGIVKNFALMARCTVGSDVYIYIYYCYYYISFIIIYLYIYIEKSNC